MFLCFFFLMIRRPPRSTRTDTLCPYPPLFLSRVLERLAHLAHDDLGEPLTPLGVQLAHPTDERGAVCDGRSARPFLERRVGSCDGVHDLGVRGGRDRKSTRLNSSH